MITKHDILKMVKRVYRESQGLPPRRLIYPTREWAIGILVTCILVLVAGAGSAYGYVYLSELGLRIQPVEPTTVRYQDTTVERVLELYELRANRFSELTGEVSVVAPPVTDAATSTATSTNAEATAVATTTEAEVMAPDAADVSSDAIEEATESLQAI